VGKCLRRVPSKLAKQPNNRNPLLTYKSQGNHTIRPCHWFSMTYGWVTQQGQRVNECGHRRAFFAVQFGTLNPEPLLLSTCHIQGCYSVCCLLLRTDLHMMKGGTYGGNAVCSAAASATIDTIIEEGLLQNAHKRGQQLLQGKRSRKMLMEIKGRFVEACFLTWYKTFLTSNGTQAWWRLPVGRVVL